MTTQVSSYRTARKTFKIERTGFSYRLSCLHEGCRKPDLGVWDWRRNALAKGLAHAFLAHNVRSERGIVHAGQRMFQERTHLSSFLKGEGGSHD